MSYDNLRRSLPQTSVLLENATPLRKSLNQIPSPGMTPNSPPAYAHAPPIGLLLGAKPGSIVERHIGSTLGDVVRLTPLQTGILRRFLPDGFVEFLLGNSVVKLEPGYELRINETIAVRRRQELASRNIQNQEVHKTKVVILLQVIANLICQDDETTKKLKSLYTVNNEIITAGYVQAVYPEGIVLSANLSCPDDYSSWIFLGDKDLKDIRVLDGTNLDKDTILRLVNDERSRLECLLSLDAGMEVTFGGSDTEPKIIESLWWHKSNVLGRKAVFDNGRACVSILALTPYHNTLKRKTYDTPQQDRSFLRLYTEFQHADLLFSVCAFDDRGVIANFKPPSPSSGKSTDSRGRCWVPYIYFDKEYPQQDPSAPVILNAGTTPLPRDLNLNQSVNMTPQMLSINSGSPSLVSGGANSFPSPSAPAGAKPSILDNKPGQNAGSGSVSLTKSSPAIPTSKHNSAGAPKAPPSTLSKMQPPLTRPQIPQLALLASTASSLESHLGKRSRAEEATSPDAKRVETSLQP